MGTAPLSDERKNEAERSAYLLIRAGHLNCTHKLINSTGSRTLNLSSGLYRICASGGYVLAADGNVDLTGSDLEVRIEDGDWMYFDSYEGHNVVSVYAAESGSVARVVKVSGGV